MNPLCALLLFVPCLVAEEPTRAPVDLREIAPRADETWVAAWEQHRDAIARMAGLSTERRLAHFLAHAAHESGGFRRFEESLDYSASRLRRVWPRRFPSGRIARRYARKPRVLAEFVYGGRMGNLVSGDGWRYRGRGPMQASGRDMYRQVGAMLGLDLVASPELVLVPEIGWLAAAAVWRIKGANGAADRDNTAAVTELINGGAVGLDRRVWRLGRVKRALLLGAQIDQLSRSNLTWPRRRSRGRYVSSSCMRANGRTTRVIRAAQPCMASFSASTMAGGSLAA